MVRRRTPAARSGRYWTCWPYPCWFRRFPPGAARSGSRLRGSHLPRRTTVQPVQLSLLPDQVPALPSPGLLARIPGADVAAAVTLLAALIAKAGTEARGDE